MKIKSVDIILIFLSTLLFVVFEIASNKSYTLFLLLSIPIQFIFPGYLILVTFFVNNDFKISEKFLLI